MNHIPKRTGLIPDVPERRFGCGIWFLVLIAMMALITWSIGWPLVASYFAEDCELPYTESKKDDLDQLVERLAVDISDDGAEIWYRPGKNYLRNLAPGDQLYIIHNAATKIGAVFHGQNKRASYFQYKISPISYDSVLRVLYPFTYLNPWVGLHFSIRVSEKNTVSTHNYSQFRAVFGGPDPATGKSQAAVSGAAKNFVLGRKCPTHRPISGP